MNAATLEGWLNALERSNAIYAGYDEDALEACDPEKVGEVCAEIREAWLSALAHEAREA